MALLNRRISIALLGVLAGVVAVPAASAGNRSQVTVRVEGLSRTLLAPTKTAGAKGWVTKGGAPRGKCSGSSAAGALDAATHHRWTGKWYASVPGIFITSILGEKASGNDYWTVFVNNRSASAGVCDMKLHAGEQLLFAVTNGKQFPLVLSAPSAATAGKPFQVKVAAYSAAGKAKPVSGATVYANVAGGTQGSHTNGKGVATFTAGHQGSLILHARANGYIRAATVRVRVSS